jgi:hypothetical protein
LSFLIFNLRGWGRRQKAGVIAEASRSEGADDERLRPSWGRRQEARANAERLGQSPNDGVIAEASRSEEAADERLGDAGFRADSN